MDAPPAYEQNTGAPIMTSANQPPSYTDASANMGKYLLVFFVFFLLFFLLFLFCLFICCCFQQELNILMLFEEFTSILMCNVPIIGTLLEKGFSSVDLKSRS